MVYERKHEKKRADLSSTINLLVSSVDKKDVFRKLFHARYGKEFQGYFIAIYELCDVGLSE